MKSLINPNTIANTVRMGARSRRPKAIFLASDQSDVALLNALLSEKECRVIPTHGRENAAKAFAILVRSGWEGVFTAADVQLGSDSNRQTPAPSDTEIVLEGSWEVVLTQSSMLSGHRVRVTIDTDESRPSRAANQPNTSMLRALEEIEGVWVGMNPKKDEVDYLREAREGAMYGLDDEG